jgi:hypothetical protein
MIKIEHNVETNEIKEIELSPKEAKEFEAIYAESIIVELNEKNEAEAKATAKAALLEKLGITEDEAKLLLS